MFGLAPIPEGLMKNIHKILEQSSDITRFAQKNLLLPDYPLKWNCPLMLILVFTQYIEKSANTVVGQGKVAIYNIFSSAYVS